MPTGIWFACITVEVIATVGCALAMLLNVSGEPRAFWLALLMGPLTPRRYLTDRGWVFKKLAIVAGLMALGTFYLWSVSNP